jgi:hypothetical protein
MCRTARASPRRRLSSAARRSRRGPARRARASSRRCRVVLRRQHFGVPAGRNQSANDGALQQRERAAAGELALCGDVVGLLLRRVGRGLLRRGGLVGLLLAELLDVGVGVQLRFEEQLQREYGFLVVPVEPQRFTVRRDRQHAGDDAGFRLAGRQALRVQVAHRAPRGDVAGAVLVVCVDRREVRVELAVRDATVDVRGPDRRRGVVADRVEVLHLFDDDGGLRARLVVAEQPRVVERELPIVQTVANEHERVGDRQELRRVLDDDVLSLVAVPESRELLGASSRV